MTQTVICMKWGTRYGPDYVNRLYSMIERHTAQPTRLVCYTDESEGINSNVQVYPLPRLESARHDIVTQGVDEGVDCAILTPGWRHPALLRRSQLSAGGV